MPNLELNHARTRDIISDQLGVDQQEVTGEKRIVKDLGADSLDQVELVMSIEDEFGLEITDEDAEKVKTVQDAYDLVDRLVSTRGA